MILFFSIFSVPFTFSSSIFSFLSTNFKQFDFKSSFDQIKPLGDTFHGNTELARSTTASNVTLLHQHGADGRGSDSRLRTVVPQSPGCINDILFDTGSSRGGKNGDTMTTWDDYEEWEALYSDYYAEQHARRPLIPHSMPLPSLAAGVIPSHEAYQPGPAVAPALIVLDELLRLVLLRSDDSDVGGPEVAANYCLSFAEVARSAVAGGAPAPLEVHLLLGAMRLLRMAALAQQKQAAQQLPPPSNNTSSDSDNRGEGEVRLSRQRQKHYERCRMKHQELVKKALTCGFQADSILRWALGDLVASAKLTQEMMQIG